MAEKFIWLPHPKLCWVPAKVKSFDAHSTLVQVVDGNEMRVTGNADKYESVLKEFLEENIDDLSDIKMGLTINDGSIIYQIKNRALIGKIFTDIGNNLIVVNLFSKSSLYSSNQMEKCLQNVSQKLKSEPHLYHLIARSINNIRITERSQALILLGISGSGKSTVFKNIVDSMVYITTSHSKNLRQGVYNLMDSMNIVLDAFGNAKTSVNSNSSRYGKYFELHCTNATNFYGSLLKSCCLEASRATTINKGERSFHIFYMLLAGATVEMREDLKLGYFHEYALLAQSGGVQSIPGRNEKECFDTFLQAMEFFKINKESQRQLFHVIAGLLRLSNISFIVRGKGDTIGCTVNSEDELDVIARNFSIEPAKLRQALCSRINTNTTKSNTISTATTNEVSLHTDPREANHQKNAIIRYIYRQLFKFIIQTINSRCFRGKCDHHISCLDFPGFENLQNNTLDQLCINYCDERLQGHFIDKTLKNEIQLYEKEGLFFGEIVAQENSKLLKLFHSKSNGMFTHIEKESTTSGKSSTKDDNILNKFYLTYVQSNATKTSLYSQENPKSTSFVIKHYKAAVTYNSSSIVSSSTQDLPPHVLKLLQSSKSTLLQNILSFGSTDLKKSVSQIGNKTVELVKDVSKILNETINSNCNFVFCVKSNDSEQRDVMDYPCMLKQLKSFEIPSLVKIVRMGFSVHLSYRRFLCSYSRCVYLLQGKAIPTTIDIVEDPFKITNIIEILSEKLDFKNIKGQLTNWAVGTSCVLIRNEAIIELLEAEREKLISLYVPQVQKVVRGHLAREKSKSIYSTYYAAKNRDKNIMRQEIKNMAAEDDFSRQNEIVINQITMLEISNREKYLKDKQKKERAEKEKLDAKQKSAVTMIQSRFRGISARTKLKIKNALDILLNAIASKNEEKLKQAITLIDLFYIRSNKVKLVKELAVEVLLALQSEKYVKSQLKDSLISRNDTMLKDAIELTEKTKNTHLPEYEAAKNTLIEISGRKVFITLLESELESSHSIPELVKRADKIDKLINRLTEYGLAGESIVLEGKQRLARVRGLLDARDKLRSAVESCSLNDMDNELEKRDELSKIYGESLFFEEVEAVESLKRLLYFEKFMYEGYQEFDSSLPRLPNFIRVQLDTIKSPTVNYMNGDTADVEAALDKFNLIVPDEEDRKAYSRVFKWVVSVALWKYQRDPSQQPISLSSLKENPTATKQQLAKSLISKPFSPTKSNKKYASSENNLDPNSIGSPLNTPSSSSYYKSRQSKAEVAAYLAFKKSKNAKDDSYLLSQSSLKLTASSKADLSLIKSIEKFGKYYKTNKDSFGWK